MRVVSRVVRSFIMCLGIRLREGNAWFYLREETLKTNLSGFLNLFLTSSVHFISRAKYSLCDYVFLFDGSENFFKI